MGTHTKINWRSYGTDDMSAEEVAATLSPAPTLDQLAPDDIGTDLLWRAVFHGHDQIASRAVDHPGITTDMLLALCQRHDRDARRPGSRTATVEEPAGPLDLGTPQTALAHPLMPEPVFEHLAEHADPCWRAAAVTNPRTPDSVVRALGMDDNERVQYEIAKNAPAELLPEQFDHFRYSNVAVIARRDDLTEPQIAALARHPTSAIRTVVASRSDLPKSVVAILGNDPDAWVRRVVGHRNREPAR